MIKSELFILSRDHEEVSEEPPRQNVQSSHRLLHFLFNRRPSQKRSPCIPSSLSSGHCIFSTDFPSHTISKSFLPPFCQSASTVIALPCPCDLLIRRENNSQWLCSALFYTGLSVEWIFCIALCV